MPITKRSNTIFSSNADALINTVNTHGTRGSGLTYVFSQLYPLNFNAYRKKCKAKSMLIGYPFIFKENDKHIINIPTKTHWSLNAKLSYVKKGLRGLELILEDYPIKSIAFPKIGCSSGLDWYYVYPLIAEFSLKLPSLDIEICTQQKK